MAQWRGAVAALRCSRGAAVRARAEAASGPTRDAPAAPSGRPGPNRRLGMRVAEPPDGVARAPRRVVLLGTGHSRRIEARGREGSLPAPGCAAEGLRKSPTAIPPRPDRRAGAVRLACDREGRGDTNTRKGGTMRKSILIPLDGSPFGEQALPMGLDLARRMGADVHLVHVHQPVRPAPYAEGLPVYTGELEEEARTREEQYLANLANRSAESAGVVVRRALLDGPIAPELARYADEEEIGLVVMTTHGRGGLSRAWLGSVADALIRQVNVPVLFLRPRKEAGAEQPREFRRILIPLDGSKLAESVLPTAEAIGRLSDAEYTLLHVVVPPFVLGPPRATVLVEPGDAPAAVERWSEEYLARVADRMRDAGLRVQAVVEIHPNAAQGILDYARAHDIDLIAMSTHGRVGFSRIALGSVSDKVLRGAEVPVLLQRGVAAAADEAQQQEGEAQLELVERPGD
nr:MAG: hypothetical protein DIU52_04610 [bacterium]